MTPRSIRRAAERKAKKVALKSERHLALESTYSEHTPVAEPEAHHPRETEVPLEATLFTPSPISVAQLAANQANAQLSTGPNTPEGQAKSSLNAVKTALTGRTVLLPSDDAPAYEHHLQAYQDDFRPLGARECDLVQSIADSAWRLKRIPCLETALFAQGHIEFAEAFNDHDPALRASMIELQTYLKYEKQIRNLQLQESRLARRREKEIAELRQLQQERRAAEQEAEKEAPETVANRYLAAQATGQPFESAANGFVFSTAQIEEHIERSQSRNRTAATSLSGQKPVSLAPRTAKQAA